MPFNKPPHEARQLLIEALRRGEYEQGRGYLCQVVDGVQKHCCLGVACRLFSLHERPLKETVRQRDRVFFGGIGCNQPERICFDDCPAMPPLDVVEWLGNEFRAGDLACDNDRGDSFAKIADKIDSWTPKLTSP